MIDHNKLHENKIFVTTDASDVRSGALLSFGPTWETARPVAFDSMTFKGAELNYPFGSAFHRLYRSSDSGKFLLTEGFITEAVSLGRISESV